MVFKGPSHPEPFCDATKADFPYRTTDFVPLTAPSSHSAAGWDRAGGGAGGQSAVLGVRSAPFPRSPSHRCDEWRAKNSCTKSRGIGQHRCTVPNCYSSAQGLRSVNSEASALPILQVRNLTVCLLGNALPSCADLQWLYRNHCWPGIAGHDGKPSPAPSPCLVLCAASLLLSHPTPGVLWQQ